MAVQGFCEALRGERNLQIHLCVTALVIGWGAYLQVSFMEWAILLLCIGVVISVELLNTAVETVVDLVSPEHHELARKAKDIAAAAVLITTIMAVIIGGLLLINPLYNRSRITLEENSHSQPAGRSSL